MRDTLDLGSLGCAEQVVPTTSKRFMFGRKRKGLLCFWSWLWGFSLAPTSGEDCCFLPSPGTPCPRLAVGKNGQPQPPSPSLRPYSPSCGAMASPSVASLGLTVLGPGQAPGCVEEQGHSRCCPQHDHALQTPRHCLQGPLGPALRSGEV